MTRRSPTRPTPPSLRRVRPDVRRGGEVWRELILLFYRMPPIFLGLLEDPAAREGMQSLLAGPRLRAARPGRARGLQVRALELERESSRALSGSVPRLLGSRAGIDRRGVVTGDDRLRPGLRPQDTPAPSSRGIRARLGVSDPRVLLREAATGAVASRDLFDCRTDRFAASLASAMSVRLRLPTPQQPRTPLRRSRHRRASARARRGGARAARGSARGGRRRRAGCPPDSAPRRAARLARRAPNSRFSAGPSASASAASEAPCSAVAVNTRESLCHLFTTTALHGASDAALALALGPALKQLLGGKHASRCCSTWRAIRRASRSTSRPPRADPRAARQASRAERGPVCGVGYDGVAFAAAGASS